VVGFTAGSRGEVPGKTRENKREEEIIIIILFIQSQWAFDEGAYGLDPLKHIDHSIRSHTQITRSAQTHR
jgi:hypothetical protein